MHCVYVGYYNCVTILPVLIHTLVATIDYPSCANSHVGYCMTILPVLIQTM